MYRNRRGRGRPRARRADRSGRLSDDAASGGENGAEGSDGGRESPFEVLADLPAPLWGPLLRAVRRAVEQVDRADVPAGLRPFATWKPERLAADRPRRAVAAALAADPRLRERVGEVLERPDAYADAEAGDAASLVADYGAEIATAALAARGRWDALALVSAEGSARLAARDRAVAEAGRERQARQHAEERRKLIADLAALRDERDGLRRRAEDAERRLRIAEQQRKALDRETERLGAELEALRGSKEEQRRRGEDRAARLRRRLQAAEDRARVDDARADRVVGELERLASELRAALRPPAPASSPAPEETAELAIVGGAEAPGVPRGAPPAVPGRPCVLPAGLTQDEPAGVLALLQVDGLEVVVDGYNVTKDKAGRPHAALPDQRLWLLRLAGRVVARRARRVTVVFDGTEPMPATLPKPRGVFAVFTRGDETADQRIVALVEHLPATTPVLVVSSDREVRADCEALGANVTTSTAFLAALGG